MEGHAECQKRNIRQTEEKTSIWKKLRRIFKSSKKHKLRNFQNEFADQTDDAFHKYCFLVNKF